MREDRSTTHSSESNSKSTEIQSEQLVHPLPLAYTTMQLAQPKGNRTRHREVPRQGAGVVTEFFVEATAVAPRGEVAARRGAVAAVRGEAEVEESAALRVWII